MATGLLSSAAFQNQAKTVPPLGFDQYTRSSGNGADREPWRPKAKLFIDTSSISWFDSPKVSFITNLFSRHRQAETTSSPLINWSGQSGKQYQYEVYSLDTSFQPLPGNFIYARQNEDGGWVPIYIAQTRDLHQRLEGHVRMEDAVANGATHLHAHYCAAGQASRCSEERDLILAWRPVCNDSIEG